VECVRRGLAQGIGYEFAGGELYGVDLDHVLDEKGTLTQDAQSIVDKLNSYTEISPSGSGVHIFVTAIGSNITRHRKQGGFVEIYNEARYFTVTGNVLGSAKPIENRAAELQTIHDKFLLPEQSRATVSHTPITIPSYEQDKFLRTGLERDKVFAALWSGQRRIGNESADDQALLNKLAYWCNAEPDAMVRAFLTSPYHQQKDESHKRKCQRSDYLPNTARKAPTAVCSTAQADYGRWQADRKRERSVAG
jgi:putative DNA primase/helicase